MPNQPAEPTVNVTDPFGKVGSLPQSQADEAFQNGYKPAMPDEVRMQKNEDRFGGVQGAIFSGALGAARSATLGGSDWALTHLPEGVGFNPEEIKGFSETNPGSTMAGEIGGLFKDPFGIGHTISAAGKATTAGAKTALKAAGIAADSSVVGETLANALGYGVEGGLYGGAANSINELALGDSDLNGEKVLSNIGYGAMLSGLGGGAFKFLSEGASPLLSKATEGLGKVRDDLVGSGFGNEALVHKVLPKRFADAITDRQLNLDTKGQASVLRNISTNLNSVLGHLQEETGNLESSIDPNAMSSMFKTSSKYAGVAHRNITNAMGGIIDQIKAIAPDLPAQELLDKFKSKSDRLTGGSAQAIFNTLKGLKDHVGDFMEKDPALAESLNPISESIHNTMKDPNIFGPAAAGLAVHEEAMQKFGKLVAPEGEKLTDFQKTFGEQKDGKWQFDIQKLHNAFSEPNQALKTKNMDMLNDFYSQLKDMPENLLNAKRSIPNGSWKKETLKSIVETSEKSNEQSFKDYIEGVNTRRPMYGWKDLAPVVIAKWHPVLAAAIEAYDFYQDPVHATHELAVVERMLGKTGKKASDLMDRIFNSNLLSNIGIEEKINKTNEKSSQRDDERFERLKRLVNNPQDFADNLQKNSKELNDVAPKMTQGLHLATSNAASFLASKLPQAGDHLSPFAEPYKPSAFEKMKFDKYAKIVEDPLHSLQQVKDGTIGPETVETMSTVYPKLYEELKQRLLEKAYTQKQKGKPIPFQTRQSISQFVGQPVDRALSPQSILSNQMMFSAPPQANQAQGQPKTRAKGLDNMKGADRVTNKYSAVSDI